MNLSTLPALGLRLSLLPTLDPNPDHDEDDNNYDRQNYADRGTARDRGTAPEGVMVGEGGGGEQRHQGGGRGEPDDQDDGQASAHNDGMVLHHCAGAHAQGNDCYRDLRCFLKREEGSRWESAPSSVNLAPPSGGASL